MFVALRSFLAAVTIAPGKPGRSECSDMIRMKNVEVEGTKAKVKGSGQGNVSCS